MTEDKRLKQQSLPISFLLNYSIGNNWQKQTMYLQMQRKTEHKSIYSCKMQITDCP